MFGYDRTLMHGHLPILYSSFGYDRKLLHTKRGDHVSSVWVGSNHSNIDGQNEKIIRPLFLRR